MIVASNILVFQVILCVIMHLVVGVSSYCHSVEAKIAGSQGISGSNIILLISDHSDCHIVLAGGSQGITLKMSSNFSIQSIYYTQLCHIFGHVMY